VTCSNAGKELNVDLHAAHSDITPAMSARKKKSLLQASNALLALAKMSRVALKDASGPRNKASLVSHLPCNALLLERFMQLSISVILGLCSHCGKVIGACHETDRKFRAKSENKSCFVSRGDSDDSRKSTTRHHIVG
jgi:hypothetical protein